MTKKCSKIISVLMALCILVSFSLPVSGAASDGGAASFSEIRDKMIARETDIPVTIEVSLKDLREQYGEAYLSHINEKIEKYFSELFAFVFQHDGTLKGGDYLYKHVGHHGYNIPKYYFDPDADVIQVSGTVVMEYYTTAEQETELDDAVKQALEEMALDGLTDYEKIVRVYGYITANVVYDYKNLNDDSYKLKYSAYAALVNKTAVCQGYANLFYLFMQKLGIDCRIITGWGIKDNGEGEAHAWNIVKLGDLYYNCDSTWDATGIKTPRYLLRGTNDFERHQSEDQFLTEEFKTAYPIAKTQYIPGESPEHKHVPQVVPAVPATCSEPGLTEGIICATCSEVLTAQTETPIDPDNHADYGTEIILAENALCYQDGYTGDTVCARCRSVLNKGEVIPKETVPHSWDKGTVTVKPTCSTVGTMLLRCTVKSCGATTEKEIKEDPDAHVFKVTVYPPTCTDPGYTSYACTLCRYGYSDNETGPLGHDWSAWTKLDDLQHQRVCSRDNSHVETADHTWDGGVITVPVTATEQGEKTFTCTLCGATKTEKIGAGDNVTRYRLGDPDNDGNITAADARLALRRSVDLEDFAADTPEFIACDVDRSGTVTAADARAILRAAVGLEEIKTDDEEGAADGNTIITYVCHIKNKVLHRSTCPSVKRMNEENKWIVPDTYTRQQLIDMGYTPCSNCNP
ncbi:MAG: hypothetical protein IJL25_10735 [Clostridia bacterium]|nr:hypothetical protein [Clostridia bacterium]